METGEKIERWRECLKGIMKAIEENDRGKGGWKRGKEKGRGKGGAEKRGDHHYTRF